MNIIDLIPCKKQSGAVGIEIELEADNMPTGDEVASFWRLEADNSLRGESGEFVLRRPIPLRQLDEAFAELTSAMNQRGTEVRPTYRAGVHVHVNVQDLTPRQLVTFISLYFMLEEVFLSFCDKSRSGNHFCLRMSDASYLLDMITESVIQGDFHALDTEDLRYASLNITSLFKYGSVEFRALESTGDFEKIKVWASALYQLKLFAKTLSSPVDILGEASETGFTTFAQKVLGPYHDAFRPWITDQNITKGIRGIQYAVYARDWTMKDLNIFSKNTSFFDP